MSDEATEDNGATVFKYVRVLRVLGTAQVFIDESGTFFTNDSVEFEGGMLTVTGAPDQPPHVTIDSVYRRDNCFGGVKPSDFEHTNGRRYVLSASERTLTRIMVADSATCCVSNLFVIGAVFASVATIYVTHRATFVMGNDTINHIGIVDYPTFESAHISAADDALVRLNHCVFKNVHVLASNNAMVTDFCVLEDSHVLTHDNGYVFLSAVDTSRIESDVSEGGCVEAARYHPCCGAVGPHHMK